MGAMQRHKGARVEREIVALHRSLGLRAERVPLSGGTRYRGDGHDVDVYLDDAVALKAEVKARRGGTGFITLERWMGGADVLFLRRDHAAPMVVMPWALWAKLIARPPK